MGNLTRPMAELKKGFDGNKDHDRETWLGIGPGL